MPEFVRGTCEEMCPQNEIKLRTKERLLHFFEQKRDEKNVPYKVVKSFSRSAAGIKAPKKSDLRTPRCLQVTIEYLFKEIVMDKRKSYPYIYDFIFDRLRCIRQEIVMQNFDYRTTLNLLEPIILFLAYSRYRLCTESIDDFDPKICDQHLQECLKKALCCYDELDLMKDNDINLSMARNRSFIEALYQIFNMGSFEALQRSINLSKEVRNATFNIAQMMSLEFYRGNYFKVISGMLQLPHILAAIASLKLQYLRQKLFDIFSSAYSSKHLTVPVLWLKRILLYSKSDDVLNDCKYYNIEVQNDKVSVRFSKANFNSQATIRTSSQEEFVDLKIRSIYLPEVLLLKRL